MASAFASKRLLKAFGYGSAIAVSGSSILYISSRSRPDFLPPAQKPQTDSQGRIVLPKFPTVKSRKDQLAELKRNNSDDNVYDLLVIGGGATGTGIALDAATRGLKVALVDRDDFSSGTSSKSTKLVHGGVRYLEKAVWNLDYNQYELVKEALRERKTFLYTAPHLSSWLPIMLPLQKWWQAPYFWAGTKCYDFLAGSEGNPSSYFMSSQKAIDAFPMLKKENLVGALVYYDGQHNDSRMNISLALTASLYGATTVNHLEVTGLEKDRNGKLCGARVRDMMSQGEEASQAKDFVVRAKGIINATGPFADAIQQMDTPQQKDMVAPSLGVHVVLPGYLSPKNMGLLDPSTSDGRVIFFLPWQGNTIAGTTDAPCAISKNPVPDEKDIDWILKEVKHYLSPDANIQRSDVLAAWAGIRPLVRDPNSKNTESLVRSHLVSVSKSGLLTCAGGKWTTYRQMAEDAVDKAIETFNLKPRGIVNPPNISGLPYSEQLVLDGSCQTHRLRLLGSHGWSQTLFINLIQQYNLPTDIAQHLAQNYGDRAWQIASIMSENASASSSTASETHSPHETAQPSSRLNEAYPFTTAEVLYATRNEYACKAVDVLARRTRLSFLDVQAALEALPSVIDTMSAELGWNGHRCETEWKDSMWFLRSMGLSANLANITRAEVEQLRAKQRVGVSSKLSPITETVSDDSTPASSLIPAPSVRPQLA